jgi:hypothetical protein
MKRAAKKEVSYRKSIKDYVSVQLCWILSKNRLEIGV